jgi:hypothetical protein
LRVLVCAMGLAAIIGCSQNALARTSLDQVDDDTFEGRYLGGWDTIWDDEHIAQTTGTTPPVTAPPPQPQPPGVAPETEPIGPPEEVPAEGEEPAVDDEFSLGDLPVVETVELTTESARKAVDVYLLVRDKYKDAELENYENLQDFVDQAPQGKAFESDVKAAGFPNVNDWNTVVTTISFAYANIVDDQTDDIKQQIEEIKADTEMAQDMRDRMVTALTAMIPSENNKKIVEDMIKDPVYGPKVKALETEEE